MPKRSNGFDKSPDRARAAGKAPKSPRAKTILKKFLERKITADSEDWKELCKRAGIDPADATRLDVMIETFSRRMVKNDASLKMGLEISGELSPGDTSGTQIVYLDKQDESL